MNSTDAIGIAATSLRRRFLRRFIFGFLLFCRVRLESLTYLCRQGGELTLGLGGQPRFGREADTLFKCRARFSALARVR